jgi:outer membrane protein OmpA-like peptidoglycan-associated protein
MKQSHLGLAGLMLVCAIPLAAQTTTYGKHEIDIFGGGSFYKRQDPRPFFDLGKGGTAGFRLTQNWWNYVGIEQQVNVHGTNNATFTLPNSFNTVSFGVRQRSVMVNPVFHFAPRDSRVRPFATAGVGVNWLIPTDQARNQALRPDGSGLGAPANLKTGVGALFNYGAGIKAKLAPRVGLRADIRGFLTQSETLGLPVQSALSPTQVVFTETSPLNSMQATAGLTFYLGKLTEFVPGAFNVGTIEASSMSVCPGDEVTLRLPVSNSMAEITPKYKWTVDGNDMGTSETLTMRAPDGPKTVAVRATVDPDASGVTNKDMKKYLRKNPLSATGRDLSITVKEYKAPGLSASASPTQIGPTGTATLTATPVLSECSGNVTYEWTVDGGTLSGTGATRTFSPAGLNLACGTTRTVNANVTIRDAKGGTATATVPVTVAAAPCPPPPPKVPDLRPTQFDDILFASGSGRVNNCGKRTLDRVYEQAMASGDYDILLVGHIDESEAKIRRRRGQKSIDRERVENAAAYLISGEQPCKRFDRSRVKIAVAGSNQVSPLRTSLCEDSVRERAGSRINPRDDKAKFRRVEVWLVPRDGKGPMPSGITGIEPAPDIAGCPK